MILKLLAVPFRAPLQGLSFVLNQVGDMAQREWLDVDHLREELLLANLRLEEGEITEEEYQLLEADILARLRAAREVDNQGG